MNICRFTGRDDEKYEAFLAQLTHFLQAIALAKREGTANFPQVEKSQAD
jgi:hypothetical protein